jgi:EmrB/QacA subfamily drug resistance transporter
VPTEVQTEPDPAIPRPLAISFAMLMVLLALAALDQTIVSTALPAIAREFHGTSRIAWVFSAYLIASTVAVPLHGRLADHYGSKPVLLAAIALFLAGSLLCGLSDGMEALVLARGLQGAGGGGFLTLAMTSVVRMFSPQMRARLQGLLGATYGLSTMAGPVVGGWIVDHGSWRWAFFINLPIGLLAAVLLARFQPRQAPDHRGAMDYPGALLLAAALICAMLATGRGPAPFLPASVFAALGAGLTAVFLWTQSRSASPLLPLALFRLPAFSGAVALSAASGVMLFAAVVFLPLYFQTVRGLTPGESGWHLMPLMAGITLASIACGRWLSRTGRVRVVAAAAGGLACLSFVALGGLVREPGASVALIAAGLFPLGMGIGALFPLVTVVAQIAAPPGLLGIATASPVMFRSVAGALGLSLLALLWSAATAGVAGGNLGAVLWTAAGIAAVAAGLSRFLPVRLTRGAHAAAHPGAAARPVTGAPSRP